MTKILMNFFTVVISLVFLTSCQTKDKKSNDKCKSSKCCSYAKDVKKIEKMSSTQQEEDVKEIQEEVFTADDHISDDDLNVSADDNALDSLDSLKIDKDLIDFDDISDNSIQE